VELVLAVSNLVVDEQETDAAAVTSGSSFYLAMRILPAAQRDAMFQVYAFCRAVDDIADSDLPRAERNAGLDRWRADIDACFAGQPPRHLVALEREIRAFDLRREDFHAMIDGMAMDAAEDICAPDEPTLDLFCDRVASAAGRLSVRIFGIPEAEGIELSHHLGRALQLTNILRDIDDDAAINRCYLPRELLAREGIAIADPATIVRDPALPRVCATLVERARAFPRRRCGDGHLHARAGEGAAHHVGRVSLHSGSRDRARFRVSARAAAQAEGAHADDRRALRAVLSRCPEPST
jgi:phytoene synthase